MRSMFVRSRHAFVAGLMSLASGWAAATLGPIPTSLKGVAVPSVPGLYDGANPIIVNKDKAIALGKALFWDSHVGSDGMACASCHFHAGADRRTRNQWAPAAKGRTGSFDVGSDGRRRGPNLELKLSEFPLVQSGSPLTETEVAGIARWSDDVVGSAGAFGGQFKGVDYDANPHDDCVRAADATFQVGGTGVRRVIERNAPTVINAAFNHRQLWDGRANNLFNGSSAWGSRDPLAGIWVLQADGKVIKERLALPNSALASQAMTAPLNDREMSCQGRTMADLGRKLLFRTPLLDQAVHPQDSVLGALSAAPNKGLQGSYMELVKQAFHPRFWSHVKRGAFGKPTVTGNPVMRQPYSQAEANFSLFFGLALQAYQSTLVSDDSPFDRSARDANNLPTDLTASQLRGLQVFRRAHCSLCHTGPNFTASAIETNAQLVSSRPWAFGDGQFPNTTTLNVVTRLAGTKGFGLIDTGFAATGVGKDEWDVGLAGKDDLGNDLSYASQFLQLLAGNAAAVKDPQVLLVRPCDLANPIAYDRPKANANFFTQAEGVQAQLHSTTGCIKPAGAFVPTVAAAKAELAKATNKRMLVITDSAFKIPTLRNIELTGPFMHNGSMATLDQVIEFYARGGNFHGASKQFGTVFSQPELQVDAQARADLKAFLESLTDERVRHERAPFDHPELKVPHGHAGNASAVRGSPVWPGLADDEFITVPAVGAQGRSTPLQPFQSFLAP